MKLDKNVQYKGFTISVYKNPTAPNPREKDDNIAEFVCKNTGRQLGDKHSISEVADRLFNDYAIDADIVDWFEQSRQTEFYSDEQVTADVTPFYKTCDSCYVWTDDKGEKHSLAYNHRTGISPTNTGIAEELDDWEKLTLAKRSGDVAIKGVSMRIVDGCPQLYLSGWDKHSESIGFAWVGRDAISGGDDNWEENAYQQMEDELDLYNTWLSQGFYECDVIGEDFLGEKVPFSREELCNERDVEEAVEDAKDIISHHILALECRAKDIRQENLAFVNGHFFAKEQTTSVFGVAFIDGETLCLASPRLDDEGLALSVAPIRDGVFGEFKVCQAESLSDTLLYRIVSHYKKQEQND